jgi:hypothetical protein
VIRVQPLLLLAARSISDTKKNRKVKEKEANNVEKLEERNGENCKKRK